MADDTPGFVSLDQHLANRAGVSSEPAQSLWQKYIAGPTNQIAQFGLAPAQAMGESVMAGDFNPLPRFLDAMKGEPGSVAKAVNPYATPTQAGIMLGTAGAGGAASAAGAPQLMQAASRVLGGVAGGLGGGIAEGGPKGGLAGATTGLIAGATGEAIGATGDYLRQMGVSRAQRIMQEKDAQAMGQAIERIPKLKGVFAGVRDAAGLEDLAKGAEIRKFPDGTEKVMYKGYAKIADYVEQADQTIQRALDQQKQQYGRTYQFPDAMHPGQFTTWENARESLAELGTKAFGGVKGQPLEPTVAGVDSKRLYAQTSRLIQSQLALVDQQMPKGAPSVLQTYNDAQDVYEAGRYLLKNVLRPAFSSKEAGRVAFNSDVVQGRLADQRVKAMQKLGSDGYLTIAPAARITPETVGMRDVYQPTGLAAQAAGVVPLPGAAYARVHVGRPQLVSPGGINPLSLSEASRTGINLGTNQLLGPQLLPFAQSVTGQ